MRCSDGFLGHSFHGDSFCLDRGHNPKKNSRRETRSQTNTHTALAANHQIIKVSPPLALVAQQGRRGLMVVVVSRWERRKGCALFIVHSHGRRRMSNMTRERGVRECVRGLGYRSVVIVLSP